MLYTLMFVAVKKCVITERRYRVTLFNIEMSSALVKRC